MSTVEARPAQAVSSAGTGACLRPTHSSILPVVVVVVFISTVQHQLVSTAINVYNTDIMES